MTCKDGTDELKMVEGNSKNKVQISGANEDIREDVTDELRKCTNSKLQYSEQKDIDFLDTSEWYVSS